MKFFKPEDFEGQITATEKNSLDNIANCANAKLEREGKVVYGQEHESGDYLSFKEKDRGFSDSFKALLINIEPIEKCTHPAEKVKAKVWEPKFNPETAFDFFCECGAHVKPKEFEVVE